MAADSKSLSRHGVDLCSGDLGVIFSHGKFSESTNAEVHGKLVRRVLRAASFFRFLVILRVNVFESMDRLKEIIRSVESKGIQSVCQIQVSFSSVGGIFQIILRTHCLPDLADPKSAKLVSSDELDGVFNTSCEPVRECNAIHRS